MEERKGNEKRGEVSGKGKQDRRNEEIRKGKRKEGGRKGEETRRGQDMRRGKMKQEKRRERKKM